VRVGKIGFAISQIDVVQGFDPSSCGAQDGM